MLAKPHAAADAGALEQSWCRSWSVRTAALTRRPILKSPQSCRALSATSEAQSASASRQIIGYYLTKIGLLRVLLTAYPCINVCILFFLFFIFFCVLSTLYVEIIAS